MCRKPEGCGIEASAINIDVELDRADANTLGFARLFDDPGWRAGFSARLAPLIKSVDQVALPALLGLRDPHAVLSELEERLGRPVFEIPTLPPSVPGMRLFEVLQHALRAAGGKLVIGAGVVSHQRTGERVVSVDTATAGSDTTYEADAFVLATGGFHSGAIAIDSHWQAKSRCSACRLRACLAPTSGASSLRTSTSSRSLDVGSPSIPSCGLREPRM